MNSSNLLNNANKELNQLLEYTNKSLQSINNKQKDLNNLIGSVQNFTALNSDKSNKIESVTFAFWFRDMADSGLNSFLYYLIRIASMRLTKKSTKTRVN